MTAHPHIHKHKIWWMGNKESSLPGLKAKACIGLLRLPKEDSGISASVNSLAIRSHFQVDLLLLDFSKAFDTVPHKRLLSKLMYYGINGPLCEWINAWLTERTQIVILNDEASKEVKVISGVPQGTVLGPLMFILYVNDINDNISSSLRMFADDCVLYRIIKSPNDHHCLQNDLDIIIKMV